MLPQRVCCVNSSRSNSVESFQLGCVSSPSSRFGPVARESVGGRRVCVLRAWLWQRQGSSSSPSRSIARVACVVCFRPAHRVVRAG
eukprot:5228243-Lingulodinium_polyedra.AAC.1